MEHWYVHADCKAWGVLGLAPPTVSSGIAESTAVTHLRGMIKGDIPPLNNQERRHYADPGKATPDAPKPLLSNNFADLHDGHDVRIVGDVRGDLRAVGT